MPAPISMYGLFMLKLEVHFIWRDFSFQRVKIKLISGSSHNDKDETFFITTSAHEQRKQILEIQLMVLPTLPILVISLRTSRFLDLSFTSAPDNSTGAITTSTGAITRWEAHGPHRSIKHSFLIKSDSLQITPLWTLKTEYVPCTFHVWKSWFFLIENLAFERMKTSFSTWHF